MWQKLFLFSLKGCNWRLPSIAWPWSAKSWQTAGSSHWFVIVIPELTFQWKPKTLMADLFPPFQLQSKHVQLWGKIINLNAWWIQFLQLEQKSDIDYWICGTNGSDCLLWEVHEWSLPSITVLLWGSVDLIDIRGGGFSSKNDLLPSPYLPTHIVSPLPCHVPSWTLFISNVLDSCSFIVN